MNEPLRQRSLLGQRVDATSYADATARILQWARAGESRSVALANVHLIMEGHDHPDYRAAVNTSDLVAPDGVPLVWVMKRSGVRDQCRVYGPDLTLRVCEAAAAAGIAVGLYGGTPEAVESLRRVYAERFEKLRIVYAYSPPFRPLTEAEDATVVQAINASGARILFVGLGCPKQELWVTAHRGKVKAVMLAVGAAFDFHSGQKRQAPRWMRQVGLEWLFRLIVEPRRLWRRYFKHNPRFVWLMLRHPCEKS